MGRYVTIKAGKTTRIMARLVDVSGGLLSPGDVSAISYSIYKVADNGGDNVAVEGHENVELDPEEVLFATLQKDANWKADKTGYNFAFTPGNDELAFPDADATYLVSVEIEHDEAGTIRPDFYVSTLPALGGHRYCRRRDIERIFGGDNVEAWADADNDRDEDKIAARIDWACGRETSRVDSRLRGGPYSVPFAEPYPDEIIDATARLAGVTLYTLRGGTDANADGTAENVLAVHVNEADATINGILNGRIELDLPQSVGYPQALD